MQVNLKSSKIQNPIFPLYIASWDGVLGSSKKSIKETESFTFLEAIQSQLTNEEALNFERNFINYEKGCILCVNTPMLLNKFFATAKVEEPIYLKRADSIRFAKVTMPQEFQRRMTSLSSKYELGEKLDIRISFEKLQNLNVTLYRDTNTRGRSVSKSGNGGGVGVWS